MFSQIPDQLTEQIMKILKQLLMDIELKNAKWSVEEQTFELIELPRFVHRLYSRLSRISDTTPEQVQKQIIETLGYQGYEKLLSLTENELKQIANQLAFLETDPCATEGFSWHLDNDFYGIPHPLPFVINSIVAKLFPTQMVIILRFAVEDVRSDYDVWNATKELDPFLFTKRAQAYIQDNELTYEHLRNTRRWMNDLFGEYGLKLVANLDVEEIVIRGSTMADSRRSFGENLPNVNSSSVPKLAYLILSAMSAMIRTPILEKGVSSIFEDILSPPDSWSLASQPILGFWEVAELYADIKESKPAEMQNWLAEQLGKACLEWFRTLDSSAKGNLVRNIIGGSYRSISRQKITSVPTIFFRMRDWEMWNKCKDN